MFTHSVLAKVEPGRLLRATEGLVHGTYEVTVTEQSEKEIAGFVTHDEGPRYATVLTADRVYCSCPDAMFRHSICKHAVVLALHVIRTPQGEAVVEEPRPMNLK